MSPGATFERVYNELKRMLAEGELPPGTPIEPALIGKQIASSITPIRDALHRLTGERLVEAPNHNGFRVPLLTEAELRDLYTWNAQVVGLAVKRASVSSISALSFLSSPENLTATASDLFIMLARATGSREHLRTITRLNDQLAPYRRVEPLILDNVAPEHAEFAELCTSNHKARLGALVVRYHQRRLKAVSLILATAARRPIT